MYSFKIIVVTLNYKGNDISLPWDLEKLVHPLITVIEYFKFWKDPIDQTLTTICWEGTIVNKKKKKKTKHS